MVIYVASAYGGDAKRVREMKRFLHDIQIKDIENTYISPITSFSHLQYSELGYDIEMELCLDLLSLCDKLLVIGAPSRGVQREIDFAKMVHMEIEYVG